MRTRALDSKGKLLLFKADPSDFEVLGEAAVGGGDAWAHLAVCGHMRGDFLRQFRQQK